MTLDDRNTATLGLNPAGPFTFTTSAWDEDDAQEVTVSVPDNSVDEQDGWQYIYLQGSGGGVDTERERVGFYFRDNDEPVAQTVTLSASPNPVTEGSTVTITATLSVDPSSDVTIPLTIPAPGGGEYTSPANAEITITGSGTGTTGTLDVQTNEDSDKVDETFTVQLATGDTDWPSGWSAGDPSSVEITIFDNDLPRVTLSGSPNPVDEGSKVTITATLSEDPTADVTIPLTIPSPGDAEYTLPTNAEITITGSGTGKTGTLDIQTNEDSDEVDETFTVQLATDATNWPSEWGAGIASSVEITINDNDKTIELETSGSRANLYEGRTAPTFKVWLSSQPTGTVTVAMTLGDRNTVTLGLNPEGPLTFTTSAWAEADAKTVTVSVPDDNVYVADGWQTVYLEGSGGGVDTGRERVLFYFRDNDEDIGPNVKLSASPNPVTEGSAVTITATLSEDPSSDVTIPLTIPAPGGGEYTSPTNAEITITGSGTGTTGTLDLQTNQDSDEDNETFTVALDTDDTDWPSGWSAGDPSSVEITITDDDKPTVSLSASPNPVGEGSTVTITATLSEDPTADVTIPLTIPAPGGGEYTSPANAEITITGTGTVTTGTLDIQTNEDSDKVDETFTVQLATGDTDLAVRL